MTPGTPPLVSHAARHAGAKQLLRKPRQAVLPWLAAFFLLSIAAWFYQQVDFAGSLDHGIPIPDVVNISRTFDNLWSTGGLDQDANQFVGISLLYGWTWLLHPSVCFLVNAGLMLWATSIYKDYCIDKLGAPVWTIVGVLGNPYLMLAMVGPNKEIPLLVLSLLYFRVVSAREAGWQFSALITCIAAFTLRDGYGAFLLGSLWLLMAVRFQTRPYAFISCIACAVVAALFGLLESIVPILGRNTDGFEVLEGGNLAVGALAAVLGLDPFSVSGGFVTFCLRTLYNLLSLAMFPIFQTTGGVYWMGLAYWLAGLMMLICMPACIVAMFSDRSGKSPQSLAAALNVGTWFMISVSLFVQPRYLMPALPLAMAVFGCSPPRIRTYCFRITLLLTGMIIFGYWLLDRAPPLADPDSFDVPSYILQP